MSKITLKATKTNLYKLVCDHLDLLEDGRVYGYEEFHEFVGELALPPMRYTEFRKHYRHASYTLKWYGDCKNGDEIAYSAFFSPLCGSPILAITATIHISDNDVIRPVEKRKVIDLKMQDLKERGMLNEHCKE